MIRAKSWRWFLTRVAGFYSSPRRTRVQQLAHPGSRVSDTDLAEGADA